MRWGGSRAGWLVGELLVAMLVGVVVLWAVVGLARGALGGARLVASRVEALEAARTIWAVLEEELSPGVFERDWHLDSDGAIALRAFRGFGRPCGEVGGTVAVAYRGRRLPDPGRDSVLVLGPDGVWSPFTFDRTGAPGLCPAVEGEREIGLSLPDVPGSRIVLLRVFERGSYHLAEGAFRYRRGGGGRQPLTPERIDEASRFEISGRGVVATVGLTPASGVGPFRWRLPHGWP